MADKAEEKPRHEKDFETFKKEYKLVKGTRDTMQAHHYKIVSSALLDEKLGLVDKTGNIDYDALLKSNDKQAALTKSIVGGYDKVLADYYKTDIKSIPKERKELVRQNLMGVNESFFKNLAWKDFTLDSYTNTIINNHLKQVEMTMMPGTYAHINPEDIPKLLKLAKLDHKFDDKLVDKLKDPMYKPVIGQLLYQNHISKGKFSDEVYEKLGLLPYLKVEKD